MTIDNNYNVCSVCGNSSDHGTIRDERFICLDCLENNKGVSEQ